MSFSSNPKEYEAWRNAVLYADTTEEKLKRRGFIRGELEQLLHTSQAIGGISGCASDAEFYKACWLPDKCWEGWLLDWCLKFREAQTKWREDARVRELR